jgi:osmotically inducible protein OsmC
MELITSMFVSVDGVVQGSARRTRTAAADGPTHTSTTGRQHGRPISAAASSRGGASWPSAPPVPPGNGTLQEGSGQVELSSSKVGTFDVSFLKRTADDAGGTTSPEELIAAAHSSCFSMALAYEIAKAGGTPESLEVSADVTLGQKDGAPTITKIALTVRGEVEGLDAGGFEQAAQAAKAGCAVSRALAGVDEITLDAALES